MPTLFDETVGGLMNVLLTKNGQHYQHAGLNGGRSIVIHVGGCAPQGLKSTPNATCFEQFNLASEEFLSMLRFDQRSKLEELQEKIDRIGQDDR